METRKILVNGKVQGVGFRYHTKMLADNLNLTGTVRNLSNGQVEIIVVGEVLILDKFTAKLSQMNKFARVDKLVISVITSSLVFSDFSIVK